VFSGRPRWQLGPIALAVSNLNSGLPTGRISLLFSEGPISLRTSGLRPFGTVLEIRSFRVACGDQRKEVWLFLSDRRESPASRLSSQALLCVVFIHGRSDRGRQVESMKWL
jgi:hypothetical protein